MKCKSCSEENQPGLKFCENCGEPLELTSELPEKPSIPQDVICKNCGVENREGVKFCEECGTPLVLLEEERKEIPDQVTEESIPEIQTVEEVIPNTHQEDEKPVKPIPKIPETVTCGNCGHKNPKSVIFCEECGESLLIPTERKTKAPGKRLKTCPECGADNNRKAKLCVGCGYSFTPVKKEKQVKKAENEKMERAPKVGVEKRRKLEIPKLSTRSTMWILVGIAVLAAGYFVISSMVVKLTRYEAQQLSNSVVYSTYPEFEGVKPYVEHTKEGRQRLSTFSYSKNVTGTIEGGVEVEFTRYIVIRVNRSKGDFEILSAY